MRLKDYTPGTRIKIRDRFFRRTTTGTFWREEYELPGNCVSRPSVSLGNIERAAGEKHVVLAGHRWKDVRSAVADLARPARQHGDAPGGAKE